MAPEQEGQDRGDPLRSLAMRFKACAGLYEAGRGLRMHSPEETCSAEMRVSHAPSFVFRNLIGQSSNPKCPGPIFPCFPGEIVAPGNGASSTRGSGPIGEPSTRIRCAVKSGVKGSKKS